MTTRRVVLLALGLAFFGAVAVLAGMMAVALGPAHPLMALWAAVPAPFLFGWLVLRGTRRRAVRAAAAAYLVVASLVTVLLWGVGWVVSEQLREGALAQDLAPAKYGQEVVALGPDTLTLRATAEAKEDGPWTLGGIWGLEGTLGYYQVRSRERAGRDVVWGFSRLKGELKVGDRVRLDSWAWPVDLTQAFAAPVKTVTYTSSLGDFPAWRTGDNGDTWVIFVHGRGAGPRQGLRLWPVFSELGLPAIFITYRNDEGVPAPPDRFYRYGETEWQELEGAVRYALDNGAKQVVLAGWSMGGAIVASFLYRSALGEHVVAAILDAPMLDFGATVDYGARQRGIPQPVVLAGKAVSRYRFDVDWAALDYLDGSGELSVPVLLIHGEADETVPTETSMALAERAPPGMVQYEPFPSATHVTSWNVDRQRYEETMRAFLTRVLQ